MSDLEEIKVEVEIKEEEFDYETHTPSCPYFNSYVKNYDELDKLHDHEIKEEPGDGPESLMARGSDGSQSAYTGKGNQSAYTEKGKQTVVIRSDALGLKRSAIQSTNSHGRSLLPIEELDQELAKKGVDVNSVGVKRYADDSENLDKDGRRRRAKKQCDCHRNDNKKPRRVVKRNPNVDNFLRQAKEEASKGLHNGHLEDESSDDYAPEDDHYESSGNDMLGNNKDQSDDDYVPAKYDYTSKRTVKPKKIHNIFQPKKKLTKSSLEKITSAANKNNSSSKFRTKNLKPTTNSESTRVSTPPGESSNAAASGDEFSRDTTSTSRLHRGVGTTNDRPKKTAPGWEDVEPPIVKFVVDNMLALQIVDSQTFKDLVNVLNPNKEVPSWRMLERRILKTYEEMKESLISKLEQVKWVSTTADCWSVNKKGYLGMTVHWLDPNTRDRKMAVLACERIVGSHTHDVLAQAMKNIHSQFGIEDKVTMTTTDNAANFQKAFIQFGSDPDDHQEEEGEAEPADAQLKELIADPPEAQWSQELEFIAFDDMERGSEDGIIWLPRQHKCAAHTLNLVASADIEERHMPVSFKKPYRSAIAKAQALWNKQGMSTVFADSLHKAINRRLTVPTNTRWNSLYNSLVVLNQVLLEKKDQLHRCMNQQRNLTVFVQTDIDIMSEYAKVMAPVVIALVQIQGEKQCFLGCLIPTLIVTKKKLASLTSGNLRFCEPLVNTLLAALDRRFATTFDDEECLLATAFHPKFRLKWMEASEKTMAKRSEVKSLMERKVEEYLRNADQETASNSSSSSEEETVDFYSIICEEEETGGGAGGHDHDRSTKNKAAYIVKMWLQAKGTDSLADSAFNGEKVLIDLFLRYNTAMPSSATVERLFFLSKDIYKAKRSSLSDHNFNMLMFMKGNMQQNLV